jgi:hypothetical protein
MPERRKKYHLSPAKQKTNAWTHSRASEYQDGIVNLAQPTEDDACLNMAKSTNRSDKAKDEHVVRSGHENEQELRRLDALTLCFGPKRSCAALSSQSCSWLYALTSSRHAQRNSSFLLRWARLLAIVLVCR